MAFAVAGVVGWFSIAGIMTIYAGAPLFAALVMGIVIECTKLVSLSWLYRNWKSAGLLLRAPLVVISLVIMLITNIGVFGYLSKGHLEQGAATIDNSAKVEQINRQIAQEQSRITDSEKIIAQMDGAVNSLIGKDQANRSLAVRKSQAGQRKQMRDEITASQKQIDLWNEEKFTLEAEVRKVEHEIGPIKYIAEVFVQSDDKKAVDTAVQIFTLLIVLILDPAAVMLLLAANHSLSKIRNAQEEKDKISEISPINEEIITTEHTNKQTALESSEFHEHSQEALVPVVVENVHIPETASTSLPLLEGTLDEKEDIVETEVEDIVPDIQEQAGVEINNAEGFEEAIELQNNNDIQSAVATLLPVEMEDENLDENLAHQTPQSEITNAQEEAILERFGSAGSFLFQTPPTSFILQPSVTRVQYSIPGETTQSAQGDFSDEISDAIQVQDREIDEKIEEIPTSEGDVLRETDTSTELPFLAEELSEDNQTDIPVETWLWSKHHDGMAAAKAKKEIKTLSWLKTFSKE